MSSNVFEELTSCLINLDETRYILLLSEIHKSLTDLKTIENNNSKVHLVIHEMSLSIAKEEHIIDFFFKMCKRVVHN